MCFATLAPTVHRYSLDLPLRPTAEAGSSLACMQVARSQDTWLWAKQTGSRRPGGHDPEEDVRACVDLLKAKVKNGAYPSCGVRGG
jgi:hypothetical protein